MTRVLIAGLGNELRQDDGVGPAVALKVAHAAGPGVSVLVNAGEPTDLIEVWRDVDVAIVVDAMEAGLAAGATKRVDATVLAGATLPAGASSHLLPLANVVELARTLGALPGRLLVFGVQGSAFGPGEGLSPAVQQAVDRVAAEILEEIGAALAP